MWSIKYINSKMKGGFTGKRLVAGQRIVCLKRIFIQEEMIEDYKIMHVFYDNITIRRSK